MATTIKTTVKLKVTADCPSHSLANISVRDLNFAIDEPTERGGTNTGPTPTDTALAALAGCTNVIAHKCAHKLGTYIGTLQISVEAKFDRRGVTLAEEINTPFVSIEQTVSYSGNASDEEVRKLATMVEQYCPLAKLFSTAGTELTTTWHKH